MFTYSRIHTVWLNAVTHLLEGEHECEAHHACKAYCDQSRGAGSGGGVGDVLLCHIAPYQVISFAHRRNPASVAAGAAYMVSLMISQNDISEG